MLQASSEDDLILDTLENTNGAVINKSESLSFIKNSLTVAFN